MASRFASHVVLLRDGRVVAEGRPDDVLTAEHLGETFDWPVRTLAQTGLGCVAVPVARGAGT